MDVRFELGDVTAELLLPLPDLLGGEAVLALVTQVGCILVSGLLWSDM